MFKLLESQIWQLLQTEKAFPHLKNDYKGPVGSQDGLYIP